MITLRASSHDSLSVKSALKPLPTMQPVPPSSCMARVKPARCRKCRPKTSPRSAANTPIWQVNDDAISTNVTGTAWYRFSSVGGGGQKVDDSAAKEAKRLQDAIIAEAERENKIIEDTVKDVKTKKDVASSFSTKGLEKNIHHKDKQTRKIIRK